MSKTETTDLSSALSHAQQKAAAAVEAERRAAEARALAAAAEAEAERQQREAREAWARGALATEEERRKETTRALNAARTAFETVAETGDLATIVARWRDVWTATAALHALDVAHERACSILGRPARLPRDHRPDFAGDLTRLLNTWARDQMNAAAEGVTESLAAATSGRGG